MLAARGVSLGLGKDINFSDLNQLNFADRALLGKLQKLKRKKEAEQPKLVIKKHVDSKTLFVACLTVIIGSVIITVGLVATIAGYFDREITDGIDMDTTNKDNGSLEIVPKMSWSKFLVKSLQYVGPILMGIGMFLLIIACVITLESRDRHTQIIQEESTELRRSKSRQLQQKQKISAISNCTIAQEDIQMNGKRRRLAAPLTPPLPKRETTTPNGLPIVRSATFGAKHPQNRTSAIRAVESCKARPSALKNDLLVQAEVHEVARYNSRLPGQNSDAKARALLRQVISSCSLSTDDDPSTSDAMTLYGPMLHTCVLSPPLENPEPIVRTNKRRRHSILEESPNLAERGLPILPQPNSEGNLAKYQIPQLLTINTRTPKGRAPIVRVDSIVELSSISTSPPLSSHHLTDRQSVV